MVFFSHRPSSQKAASILLKPGYRFIGLLLLTSCAAMVTSRSASAEQFIGVAMSESPLRIDRVVTGAGATIFPGNLIETSDSPARLRMTTGDMFYLAPGTRARVFAGQARIEAGTMVVNSKDSYLLIASSLKITPEGPALEQVTVNGNQVQVSVMKGVATIKNANDITVGRVLPTQSFRFTAGLDAQRTRVTGRLSQEHGREVLRDDTSGLTFRLQGENVSALNGRRVEASGNVIADSDGAELLAVNSMVSLAEAGMGPQAGGAAIVPAALTIVIEEGDNAVNDIQQRVTREVIVRVDDENHRPVSEAAVTMLLPRSGASGIFSTGSRVVNLVTDDTGRVKASFTPQKAGQFKIQITATKSGHKAEYSLLETNQVIAGSAAAASGAGAAAGTAGGAASGGGIGTAGAVVIGGVVVASVVAPIAAVVRNTVESDTTSSFISPGPSAP